MAAPEDEIDEEEQMDAAFVMESVAREGLGAAVPRGVPHAAPYREQWKHINETKPAASVFAVMDHRRRRRPTGPSAGGSRPRPRTRSTKRNRWTLHSS